MKWLVILSILSAGHLGACATTSEMRERGLVGLREALQLSQPVGRVVAGRLVHTQTGLPLLALPNDGWRPGRPTGHTLLFEGTPGIALMLGAGDASVVRMNGDKTEWAPVLQPEFPKKTVAVFEVDAPLYVPEAEAPEDGDHGLAEDQREVSHRLDVPNYPDGATATLYGVRLTITRGAGLDGEQLLDVGGELPFDDCGGGYHVTLERGEMADGATWFHYAAEVGRRDLDGVDCTDGMRAAPRKANVDGTITRTSNHDVWFVFPADGSAPRTVVSESSNDEGYSVTRSVRSELWVPGGRIEFRSETNEGYDGDDMWSWTLYPDVGEPFELSPGE